MAKIPRKTAVIFGSNAAATPINIGVFGSLAAGTPLTSTDLAVIQAAPAFANGWGSAIVGNFPAFEDENSVAFVASQQIAYILQQGVAEWDAGTTYYTNSVVQSGGQLYISITDANLNNAVSSAANWKLFTGSTVTLSGTLSGDVNNYIPAGGYTQTALNVIKLNTSNTSNFSKITGLNFASVADGQRIRIQHDAPIVMCPIILVHEHPGSTAANRFVFPGMKNINIYPYQCVDLVYDATQSRWLAITGTGGNDQNNDRGWQVDFNNSNGTGIIGNNISLTLSSGTKVVTATPEGVKTTITSPATSYGSAIYSQPGVGGFATVDSQEIFVKFSTELIGSLQSLGIFIYQDGTGTTPPPSALVSTDVLYDVLGYGLSYNEINSVNFRLVTNNSSSSSACAVIDTGIAVTASTEYLIKFYHSVSENKIYLYINGVIAGTAVSKVIGASLLVNIDFSATTLDGAADTKMSLFTASMRNPNTIL